MDIPANAARTASMAWARRGGVASPTPCSRPRLGEGARPRGARRRRQGRRGRAPAHGNSPAGRGRGGSTARAVDRNHEGDARDAAAALELAVAGDPTDLGAAPARARASPTSRPRRWGRDRVRETCGLRRLLASARHHGVDVDVLAARTARGCVEIKFGPSIRVSRGRSEVLLSDAVESVENVVSGFGPKK